MANKLPTDIIIKPIVTEKSMDVLTQKKYTFKVAKSANKIEIANAVEALFKGTVVDKVTTISVKGHFRRQGKFGGHKPDWKKAIVKLTEKSKGIEFFDSMQ